MTTPNPIIPSDAAIEAAIAAHDADLWSWQRPDPERIRRAILAAYRADGIAELLREAADWMDEEVGTGDLPDRLRSAADRIEGKTP